MKNIPKCVLCFLSATLPVFFVALRAPFYRGFCVVVLFVVLRAPGTTQFAQFHRHVSRPDFSQAAPIFPRPLQGRFFPQTKCSVLPRYLMADGENTSKGNYRQSDRVFF